VKSLPFHSMMHFSAEGIPELTEAPAPRKSLCGVSRLIEIERTNASNGMQNSAFILLAGHFSSNGAAKQIRLAFLRKVYARPVGNRIRQSVLYHFLKNSSPRDSA